SLRERIGADGLERLLGERVTILEGDVAENVPGLPADLDLVFHCAATVSFDPPIDHAFAINLLGATRVYEAVAASGTRPHVVHVSTAYVAGMTKGVVPETTLEHRVDWRTEAEAAASARRQVEDASRKPEMLDRFIDNGRGSIPEFPGLPEGVVDLIPIDLAVNAILAVAANPPEPERGAAYYHVSSGARNPLTYVKLYEYVRAYFERHPLPERGRGEIRVPEWKFPGRRKVERRLRAGEKLLDATERLVSRLPRSNRVRELVRRVDRERGRLDFVRRYADLYGAYVEIEVIYTDDRMLALHQSLPEEDRQGFPFDSGVIDWRHYLQDVHCPAVTVAMRAITPERPKP